MLNLRLVSPVLMWIIVISGILCFFHFLQHVAIFHRNAFTIALALLSFLNWIYFFIGAIAVNRTAAKSAAAVRSVVTTGVYAKVRHPIYSADIVLAWGVFLVFPTLKVAASAAWLTVVLLFWMKLEEAALTERFGEEYTRYKGRTAMFIPRYWRA